MEKINFDSPITDRMVMFTERVPFKELQGVKISILSNNGVRFDDKIDMRRKLIIRSTDTEYLNAPYPTINDLIAVGKMIEWYPYAKIEIYIMFYINKSIQKTGNLIIRQ